MPAPSTSSRSRAGPYSIGEITETLRGKILGIREWRPRATRAHEPVSGAAVSFDHVRPGHGLIAIGASTGGPQAIEALLTRLPAACPPILIAQHMPEHFTRTYAERLDKICPMRVVEAHDRQVVESGVAYVAPGNRHMLVEREGVRLVLRLSDARRVHHQRPAVDVLFHSVAKLRAVKVVALLLTGMGQDGADGMVELRQHKRRDDCRARAVVRGVRHAARGHRPRRRRPTWPACSACPA